MTTNNDIICAAATAPGKAALAIVRVSGTGAIALVAEALPALSGIGPNEARKLVHGFLQGPDGEPLDEVTAIPYFASKSYTAEEMVEIICHGGYASSHAILSRLTSLGIRLAEPGEFTSRAFLNGRISLSEAEAVAAAIEAKSELALKAAARNLKGELFDKIDEIKQAAADLLALLEAEIDFSEEEIDKTPVDRIGRELTALISKSEAILGTYDFGRGLNSGYKVAIVGRANVGKSSLLNVMLNRERAIVTDIPGTTRDTLTEWIEIAGFPVLLTDTAGLRESADPVEAIGQERTRLEIENSDLILFMIDGAAGVTDEDLAIYRALTGKPRLVAANKVDLRVGAGPDLSAHFGHDAAVFISARSGAGFDELKSLIARHLHIDTFRLDTALLATERQYRAMTQAVETLRQASTELAGAPQAEVIAICLREALDHLGELVGETTNEDILQNIFNRFCIGK